MFEMERRLGEHVLTLVVHIGRHWRRWGKEREWVIQSVSLTVTIDWLVRVTALISRIILKFENLKLLRKLVQASYIYMGSDRWKAHFVAGNGVDGSGDWQTSTAAARTTQFTEANLQAQEPPSTTRTPHGLTKNRHKREGSSYL